MENFKNIFKRPSSKQFGSKQLGLKQLGFLIIMLLQLSTTVNAGNLSSTVDRNQISPNETLTLTVTYDEQVDSSQLDLKNLEQDFEILGVSPQTTSSVSIVNGQASRQASTIWTITLIAKRPGTLGIPAFSIQHIWIFPVVRFQIARAF